MEISFLLSVIALSFSFCPLAKAQRPGGVASPEVWFRTVPATSNLQGYYLWKDFSGDSVRNLLYDSRGAAYGTEFRQQRDNITAGAKAGGTKEDFLEDGGYVPIPNGPHIVYQPSTPAGVDSHVVAKSKIKGSPVIDVPSKMNKEIKESGYAR